MVDTTKILLFKKEAVYATDAAPTGAANAALTRNFSTKPVAVDRVQRNLDRTVLGSTPDAPSNERQTISYELEMAGSGAAGTAPAWMEHLEACRMAPPAILANTSATQRFAPIATEPSSATAHHWHGNQKRIGLGGRGTFGWDVTAGALPFWRFEMTLLLPPVAAIVDAAPPAVITLDRWKDPVEVNTANTDFTLDGFALRLRSFTGDANAQVAKRALVGAEYVSRGNHGITGRIMGDAPTIAAKDYFRTLRSGDQVPVQLIHGTVAGHITQLDLAHVQIVDIDLNDEEDQLMVSISYRANVGTTNDDLVITAR